MALKNQEFQVNTFLRFFKAPICEYYFCDIGWKKDMIAKSVKGQDFNSLIKEVVISE